MNNKIQISLIIMLIKLINILCFLKIPNSIISSIELINIFIILIMYFTNCDLTFKLKILLTIIKFIFLYSTIKKSKLNLKYYIISSLILLTYYISTNIREVYSCVVTNKQLIITYIFSSIIYYLIYLFKN